MDARFDFNIAGPIFTVIVNTLWLEPAMRNLMDPHYVKQYMAQNELNEIAPEDVEQLKVQRRNILNDMMQRYKLLMNDGVERSFGDRRIEMVFIGQVDKMKQSMVEEVLA